MYIYCYKHKGDLKHPASIIKKLFYECMRKGTNLPDRVLV